MKFSIAGTAMVLASQWLNGDAFMSPTSLSVQARAQRSLSSPENTATALHLDLVTYMRTEWVSAALCTNQTPKEADVCVQLGTEDGRAVTFIPKTIRSLITSSAEKDGKLTVAAQRQLKQNQDRRGAAKVKLVDQPADDLNQVEDESVDVVISLQAAARMMENGLDWKKSVREAARVLKPGGRFLFVEQTELAGEKYIEYIQNLYRTSAAPDEAQDQGIEEEELEKNEVEYFPVFAEIGSDPVDLVLTPHLAGVAIKASEMVTAEERAANDAQAEQSRLSELSIKAFEKGIKKRRKKKKKKEDADKEQS